MTFKWQGVVYDTAAMQSFTTSNPAIPLVCLAPDARSVFVVRVDRLDGVEVHLADAAEAQSLAERYGIPELLQALGCAPPATGNAENDASKWRVLIVEDDAASRHGLGRLLKLSGYDVTSAATLSEAEGKLHGGHAHLILDLNLPDGHGTLLLQKVRDQHLSIKVAVTTAATDPALISAASNLQPDVVFRKPLDLVQVVQWLDAA